MIINNFTYITRLDSLIRAFNTINKRFMNKVYIRMDSSSCQVVGFKHNVNILDPDSEHGKVYYRFIVY